MTGRTVAQHFGDLIAMAEYSAACNLLSKEMQSATTPEVIKAAVTSNPISWMPPALSRTRFSRPLHRWAMPSMILPAKEAELQKGA